MLRLQKIALTQFKNYDFEVFTLLERVTGICGLNGKGKTNLLDAIHYCCFTKSYFSNSDALNVQFTKDGFRLAANFELNQTPENLLCIHRGVGKKELSLNDIPYEKFSHHIGKFPCVMIAPDDVELITGGSEERRKFLDTVICQIDSEYLQQLIIYTRVLQQRNSLLKSFNEQGKIDDTLLAVFDAQLAEPGNFIFEKRKAYTERLLPMVKQFYAQIAGDQEIITLGYESKLFSVPLEQLLLQNRERDLYLQRTNNGIHKDDISIELNNQSFKQIASQGQRKSLLFALKLAEFELLKQQKGFAPLLLLDDVFEKLDEQRMQNLLHWVCCENDGQVFITDTHKERLEKAIRSLEIPFQIIEL
ncbi:MAG: DNA replication/repair protein RecF [Ferruginibacter sp.]